MSGRQRRRRGNARQRLQKQLEIQRELEKELQNLNGAQKPEDSCQSIIQFVNGQGADPMQSEDNPFKQQGGPCDNCCLVLWGEALLPLLPLLPISCARTEYDCIRCGGHSTSDAVWGMMGDRVYTMNEWMSLNGSSMSIHPLCWLCDCVYFGGESI